MSRLPASFLKASLIYLLLGATLGVLLAWGPSRDWLYQVPGRYNLAHAHLNLTGFVAMMIYGVAYHALPRFVGRQLYSTRLGWVHFGLANAGTAGMVTGFLWPGDNSVLPLFGLVQAVGMGVFAWNLYKTMSGQPGE